MTRDDIIRMAMEARLTIRGHYDDYGSTPLELERFAELAAASEREARKAAQMETIVLREELTKFAIQAKKDAYQRGVRDEREACANMCEVFAAGMENGLHQGMSDIEARLTNEFAKIGRDLAETIRMRGNK